ncbi:DUF389 domain-containing protein [Paenarthrobacter sp. Z7-10]|uniref:DUF389 domain-containing protein n=1 Tax=Paenarthrobacter sp. Z7-10 TaxID=2787635 RepID=UPI0022A8FFB0|nr:DUF389 domain-containing protein [Paenarthrobacter sp. Z7-10]MCZ2404337.1 DUF389 domain-containing protein [Paenarthrobacter sp. Z7-10]
MTLQIRVVAPAELTARVLDAAAAVQGTADVAVFSGASVVPAGDVVVIHAAREATGELIKQLTALEVPRLGSITVTAPELVLSERSRRAEERAPGEGADAVIWEEVEANTNEDAKLSWSYLAFLVIALQLAGIGIVTDSTIAIVGAMVVGPEFGPLAGLALALVDRRWSLAGRSAVALGLGFPIAMAITAAAVWISIPLGLVDPNLILSGNPATEFIYHPGPYSFIVALLAGAAGMLSLIGRKSSVLVGVFISVTTVPAAGFVAVGLVLGAPDKAAASAIQLLLNLAGIILSASAVLLLHRVVHRRRPGPADPLNRNPYRRSNQRRPPGRAA